MKREFPKKQEDSQQRSEKPFKRSDKSSDGKRQFNKDGFSSGGKRSGDKKFGDKRFGDKTENDRPKFSKPEFGKKNWDRGERGEPKRKFEGRPSENKKPFYKKDAPQEGGEASFDRGNKRPYHSKFKSDSDNKREGGERGGKFEKPFKRPYKESGFKEGEKKRQFSDKKEGWAPKRERPNGEGDDKKPERFKKSSFNGDDKKPYPKKTYNKSEDNFNKPARPKKAAREEDDDEEDDIEVTNKKASTATAIDAPMTLNKYIAHSGECSRRDAAEFVKQGKVRVNGELVLDPGYRVAPGDTVSLSGKKMTPQKDLVYVLLNKPKDFITTTDDPEDRKTVMDLVANAGVDRLYPVGRLDRKTTGLLLLTNDGALAHRLSHPSFNIRKVYHVTLDKNLAKADYDAIFKGVVLEDGPAPVDEIAYLESRKEVGVEIHNGRNRIVRRIFESLGYEVEKLDRVSYADLTKKNLPRGKWRFLDEKEIIYLKHFNSKKQQPK